MMIKIYRKHENLKTYPDYDFPDKHCMSKEDRLTFLWNMIFYDSLTFKYKATIRKFYKQFYKDMNMITKFFVELNKYDDKLLNETFGKLTGEVKRIYKYNYDRNITSF